MMSSDDSDPFTCLTTWLATWLATCLTNKNRPNGGGAQ